MNTLPSFVKDSRDVLLKLLLISLPKGALLVGIDVKSLYTTIPHYWGIAAIVFFLEQHFPQMGAHNKFVVELLELILNNYFSQFLGKYYQQ